MVIDHKKIILSRTGKGLSLRKIAGFLNVAFFWGVMLYLTRSLVMTVWSAVNALLFGADAGLVDVNVARVFFLYLAFIVVATSTLWSWAAYNRRRYGGTRDKRRVHPDALTLAQIGDYTGFPVAKLRQMRRSKVLVAHFDEAREMCDMDSYASVGEKERLVAAGRRPPTAKGLDLVMARGDFDNAGEAVTVEYYLEPLDSGLSIILDVEVEDAELVG